MSLVNNQITATSRQLRHLRISFSIVYTSCGTVALYGPFYLFFLQTIKGYGSAASAFAARSLKKKQNDKIFIQPFVDDAKCGECHINMYTNVQMYLNDDRLHLENHRSASGNNTCLSGSIWNLGVPITTSRFQCSDGLGMFRNYSAVTTLIK